MSFISCYRLLEFPTLIEVREVSRPHGNTVKLNRDICRFKK